MDEEDKARRVQELYREALDLAEQAVLYDTQYQYEVAICLYNEASNVFNQIIDEDLETTEKVIQIQEKANEYVNRANFLTAKHMNNNQDNHSGNTSGINEFSSLESNNSRPLNAYDNNYSFADFNNYDNSFGNSINTSNSPVSQPSVLSNINETTTTTTTATTTNTINNNTSPNISPTIDTTINMINTNAMNTNNGNNSPVGLKASTPTSVTSTTHSLNQSITNNQSFDASEEFNDMKYVIEEFGNWNSENAGGSISNYSFYKNPQYKLNIYPTLGENGFLKAIAKTKNNLPVNIRLVGGGNRVSTVSKSDITSGAYRHGQCSFEILSIEPGDYTIIVSTFHRNEEGEFSLTIGCSIPFSLTPIPPEGDGMLETVIDGQWIQGVTAMGCVHYNNYFKNPTYKITITEPTYILIRLQIQTIKPPGMHVAIFELQEDGTPGKEIASSGAYCNLIQGVLTNKILLIPETEYIIIFSTWEPSPGPFTAFIYTTNMIEIQEVCNQ